MGSKLRVQKRLYYKIGEACKELGIQPYVLRYWETEFPALAPSKSRSGQRVYSEKELEIIRRIKTLLYDEGYTIAGAKKKLESELASGVLAEPDREGDEAAPEAGAVDDGAQLSLAPAPVQEPAPAAPKTRQRATRTASLRPAPVDPTDPTDRPDPSDPAAAEPAQGVALDTHASEQVQTLRSGIEKALQEAREILALLDTKPS